MPVVRPLCLVSALLSLLAGTAATWAADTPLSVLEPSSTSHVKPRTPERARWSWDQTDADITATGDLVWKPKPFVYQAGAVVRYIDYENGSDDADGTKGSPWKHHPWDAAASGNAKASHGVVTYVFKRGVTYRGELMANESGVEGDPIRLTSDPSWGTGVAVISGAQQVTHWTQGSDRSDMPDGTKVWYADLDFAPRAVWQIAKDGITRVDLARLPHWTVSDPEEVKSEWYRLEQPGWWNNGCTALKVDFAGHRSHLGIDTAHLTGPASDYVGATIHVEYGWVMGTPFPSLVEGFDESRKGLYFQGIWFGDSENIPTGMHYYLEDKPNFLDAPGNFWFDHDKKRLYVRLPGDADPSSTDVEVAQYPNLIESMGISHLSVTGLTFRFTNYAWDLWQPAWGNPDINNAAIRVRGQAEDVRIAHCVFEHCAKAVRIDAQGNDTEHRSEQPLDHILVTDNDIDQTDHGAIEIDSHSVGDVRVLRNRLHLIGLRTFRQDHSHALVVSFPQTMEVAGNILDRCTGAGLFLFGGKGSGDPAEVPLIRNLVHHNRSYQALLSANDWGSIETWQGGPFYNYDNISGDPNGFWNGYDPNKPGSARLGFAYYHDGAFKNYDFNEVAYGNSTDWKSKQACMAAFYEATPTIYNQIFNCTISKFWVGSQWSPAGGRHFFLGNIFDQIGERVFDHGALKEDTGQKPEVYPHDSMAYGRNVFSNIPDKAIAVYESKGTGYDTPQAMSASFADHPALAGDVGTTAPQSPLVDPDHQNFHLKPGSAAAGHGAKVFVPWALARTVGEWQFRRNQADPTKLLDDHWYMMPYLIDRGTYYQTPVNNLTAVNVTAADYVKAPLENWTDAALRFNGSSQYASLTNATMTTPFAYKVNNQPVTASGLDLATPDVGTSSMLIEAYLSVSAHGAAVLVSKQSASAGYQLAINKAGGVTFSVSAGGPKAELASGAIITDGAYHHIVAELDRSSSIGTIYTDGVKTAQGPMALASDASLSNDGDLLVGKGPNGNFFAGTIEFLRITRSTLAESKTKIEELYDWEFDGPFLRDFAGKTPGAGGRDAGAFQH